MKDFIKFAYHSNDDKVLAGVSFGVIGAIMMLALLGYAWINLIEWPWNWLSLVFTMATGFLSVGYLLVEDARRAQIGDNAQDDA